MQPLSEPESPEPPLLALLLSPLPEEDSDCWDSAGFSAEEPLEVLPEEEDEDDEEEELCCFAASF